MNSDYCYKEEIMKVVNKYWSVIALAIVFLLIAQASVFAEADSSDQKYFFDEHYRIDKDKGFSLDEKEKIKTSDPHYGWSLGSMYVSGYTQRTVNEDGDPVFLKNVGDQVKLGFKLEQDIDRLNGNNNLSIAIDKKAYDDYFEVPKTSFGRGALIIQHTDYQNAKGEPIVYTDYLSADSKVNANTLVEVNEEGDYEVALDYVIKDAPRSIFGKDIMPSYSDYTIRLFRFSVRNGNSMVFPFDVKTGEELSNKSFTENGFRIDLARSHYLNVYVKRDILNGDDVKDTRENKPAKDGTIYTDEGVYTITVEDTSTNQITTKMIYVGTEDRYKALVTTGLSLEEIDKQIAEGAQIADDGTLIPASTQVQKEAENTSENTVNDQDNNGFVITVVLIIIILILILLLIIRKHCKNKRLRKESAEGESK